MNYGGMGYPATVSSGFAKSVPAYGKAVAPGAFGKPFVGGFGKPVVGGFGKPVVGGFGKPVVGGFGKPVVGGFPATKASGYSTAIPATTVATSPYPGAI